MQAWLLLYKCPLQFQATPLTKQLPGYMQQTWQYDIHLHRSELNIRRINHKVLSQPCPCSQLSITAEGADKYQQRVCLCSWHPPDVMSACQVNTSMDYWQSRLDPLRHATTHHMHVVEAFFGKQQRSFGGTLVRSTYNRYRTFDMFC